jgi:hypothetical protein
VTMTSDQTSRPETGEQDSNMASELANEENGAPVSHEEEAPVEVDKMGNPAPKYPQGPKQVFFSWVAILFAVFLVSLVSRQSSTR